MRPSSAFLHHAFWYETTRNYIWPDEFTALFDYELRYLSSRSLTREYPPTQRAFLSHVPTSRLRSDRPDCWGWVNQGFVNVLGALISPCTGGPGLTDPLPVGFTYYGRDRDEFMADMEAQVRRSTPRWIHSPLETWRPR